METLYFDTEAGTTYLVPHTLPLPAGTLALMSAGTGTVVQVDADTVRPYLADAAAMERFTRELSEQVTKTFAQTLAASQGVLENVNQLPEAERPHTPQELQRLLWDAVIGRLPPEQQAQAAQVQPMLWEGMNAGGKPDANTLAVRDAVLTQMVQNEAFATVLAFQRLAGDAEVQRLVETLQHHIEHAETTSLEASSTTSVIEPPASPTSPAGSPDEVPPELQIDVSYILSAFDTSEILHREERT